MSSTTTEFPEHYRQDLVILQETAVQLQKDFGGLLPEKLWSGNAVSAFDEMKACVLPVLSEMENKEPTMFHALMYRIDISEKEFRKLHLSGSREERLSVLADKVIQREFQKVLTRKYFSDIGGSE